MQRSAATPRPPPADKPLTPAEWWEAAHAQMLTNPEADRILLQQGSWPPAGAVLFKPSHQHPDAPLADIIITTRTGSVIHSLNEFAARCNGCNANELIRLLDIRDPLQWIIVAHA